MAGRRGQAAARSRSAARWPCAPDPTDLQRAAQDKPGRRRQASSFRRKRPSGRRTRSTASATSARWPSRGQVPQGNRRVPHQVQGPVLRCPRADQLHVPPPHARRHPQQPCSFAAWPTSRRIWGGGYADVTTRANLQVREIGAAAAPEVLTRLFDVGPDIAAAPARTTSATSPAAPRRGSTRRSCWTRDRTRGASTTTSSTTASCMACRASSTSPSTAAAPSPCWRTPTTSPSPPCRWLDGFGVAPGVYYRLALGGITGHKDFARQHRRDRSAGGHDAGVATLSSACSSPAVTALIATRRG